jgi:hypothetical protein
MYLKKLKKWYVSVPKLCISKNVEFVLAMGGGDNNVKATGFDSRSHCHDTVLEVSIVLTCAVFWEFTLIL